MTEPVNPELNRNMLFIGDSLSTFLFIRKEVGNYGYDMEGLCNSDITWNNTIGYLDKYCPKLVFIRNNECSIDSDKIINYIHNNYIDTFIVLQNDTHPLSHYHLNGPIMRQEIINILNLATEYHKAIYHMNILENILPQHVGVICKRNKI